MSYLQLTFDGSRVPQLADKFYFLATCAECGDEFRLVYGYTAGDGATYCDHCADSLFAVCDSCGEYTEDPEKTDCDGNVWCADCADGIAICESCGKGVDSDDAHVDDCGDSYCSDCYWEIYTRCEDCGCEVSNDNAYYDEDSSESLCERCYHNRFTTCDGCREEIRIDDCYHDEGGNDWCSDCYYERFSTCEHCDNEYDVNEGCSCQDDDDDCQPVACNGAPPDGGFTFGIELETCYSPNAADCAEKTGFVAKHDGSINGMEFTSLILSGEKGIADCIAFCSEANRRGYRVDSTCGYHIHIGIRHLAPWQKKLLAYAYRKTYHLWATFVSATRRENRYCRAPIYSVDDVETIETEYDFVRFCERQNRYQWANFSAYNKYGTVEIRLHSGTLNGGKVANWALAHIRFIAAVVNMTADEIDAIDFDGLARIVGPEVYAYLMERRAKFA